MRPAIGGRTRPVDLDRQARQGLPEIVYAPATVLGEFEGGTV
jgi:hypothetical protein